MSKNAHRNQSAPSLLNSSFYSSNSMNTLEHAKNFRNSLILRDSSDQSLSCSHQSDESVVSEEDIDQVVGSIVPSERTDRETITMQMKNSPSLSALAGILNEKSRQADEKARLSKVIDSSILREEEETGACSQDLSHDTSATGEWNQTSSPNLIDIHDTNSVTYPVVTTTNTSDYEQPDFLSTPKVHSRRNTNPFLQSFEPSRSSAQEPFTIQSSILEEPEFEQSSPPLKAHRNTRNRPKSTSILLDHSFDQGDKTAAVDQIDMQRYSMLHVPAVARDRSNGSIKALDQRQFDVGEDNQIQHSRQQSKSNVSGQPETKEKHADTLTTRLQSKGSNLSIPHSDEGNKAQSNSVSHNQRPRRHSRATTLEKTEIEGKRTHHRAHTIDHSYLGTNGPSALDQEKLKYEKNFFEDHLDELPKGRHLRNANCIANPSSTQRAVSAGSVLDQSSSNKRRSFFSLFKKKSSKDVTPKKSKQSSKWNQNSILSSNTFNSANAVPTAPSPEKLAKKSHSTNTIFSTFRKNKDKDDSALLTSTTPPRKESQLDAISKESSSFSSVKKEQPLENFTPTTNDNFDHPYKAESIAEEPIEKGQSFENTSFNSNKYTEEVPLEEPSLKKESSEEKHQQIFEESRQDSFSTHPMGESLLEGTHFDDPLIKDLPKPNLPFLIKHDAGEALFPKSLDKYEVESIVSLERSRSVKSNRSHRRSLTDTLSVNAQNEGMFVTEASPAILSTPDLSKSPTSSILRNGRFDSVSVLCNVEDKPEDSPMEKDSSEVIPKLSLSPNRSPIITIEKQFDLLTVEDINDDVEENKEIPKQINNRENTTGDDPEFTSEMIEFASLINFGDGLTLDLDVNSDVQSQKLQQDPLGGNNVPQESCESSSSIEEDVHIDAQSPDQEVAMVKSSLKQSSGSLDELQNAKLEDHINKDQIISANDLPESLLAEEPTDIPNELLEEIRSPSSQAFGQFHEGEDVHRQRHIFRDILASQAYAANDPSSRPVSMSFKGLSAPSLNQSASDWPLFESQDGKFQNPTVQESTSSHHKVNFSSKILLYDTYSLEEYDRKPEIATCNMLTPQSAHMIKAELNQLKSEMEVHEASRCYTHFF
ncbi:BNI4 (YNL233W) [Zygosaccharomyces parabailii]|nr:BNI4 (YNL233W) [Zygosaccharomyces parabailii]